MLESSNLTVRFALCSLAQESSAGGCASPDVATCQTPGQDMTRSSAVQVTKGWESVLDGVRNHTWTLVSA